MISREEAIHALIETEDSAILSDKVNNLIRDLITCLSYEEDFGMDIFGVSEEEEIELTAMYTAVMNPYDLKHLLTNAALV